MINSKKHYTLGDRTTINFTLLHSIANRSISKKRSRPCAAPEAIALALLNFYLAKSA
ncbi:hypothetical protein [Scytonema sp. PCC 10023]|uniref:hypothetical protein n=1 Tax=Scytonema sp. PCC 10023 TaxID=1680591 RepID=UPI0039C6DFDF